MAIHRKSVWQRRVEKFMGNARQEVPKKVVLPNEGTRRLRAALILEEALETIEALGFTATGPSGYQITAGSTDFLPTGEPDLVEIADGCADIMVVTLGTLSACGIADESVMMEVLDSNDSKFAEGHYINEIGKLVKSPLYRPARIDQVLISQTQ
jgi:predicted HAD superfamily Cof-like phosphohydrolase